MNIKLTFRWLGIAGIELSRAEQVLLIDPCLTRIRFWQLWFGRIQPDQDLLKRFIPRADAIFITHAHYDHLLDTPVIAAYTGAKIYGSANACQICRSSGLPAGQLERIFAGQKVKELGFSIQVIPARHRWVPFFTPGSLTEGLQPPFTAHQYRLDEDFSFHIHTAGLRLLVDSGSLPQDLPPADILLTHPFHSADHYRQLLDAVQPSLVIPTHWDDLWVPVSQPARPTIQPPTWQSPFIRRVDLDSFRRDLQRIEPSVRVFVPDRLQVYNLLGLLEGDSRQDLSC